jgi:hypothetical protein
MTSISVLVVYGLTLLKNYLNLWKPQIAAAKSVGKEFIIGEYSSISCSGKQNVSDTFGQAMWLADSKSPPYICVLLLMRILPSSAVRRFYRCQEDAHASRSYPSTSK